MTGAGSEHSAMAEAAAWLARLHSDTRMQADERAFAAWLAADSTHVEAFDHVTAVWNAAGALSPVAGLARLPRRPAFDRRAVLAGAAVCAAVGVSALAWRAATAGVYATKTGEQRQVALEDGSHLLLDTETQLSVHYGGDVRALSLQRGRVSCRISDDIKRPFLIKAAGTRVLASGGAIDVGDDQGRISVIVLTGQAKVRAAGIGAASDSVVVPAGARFTESATAPARIDRPDLGPLTAWQNRQAIFNNTTLADAAREMNRYSTVKLTCDDSGTAAMRISGVYRVGDTAAFARSVAALLPVTVRESDDAVSLSRPAGENSATGG